MRRSEAHCAALIARLSAGEPCLYPDGDENLKYAVFGYVLALAARQRPRISVLDYGGNLGDYYWLARALVPGVELDYHCKELPKLAEVGRQITPGVTWHSTDACLDSRHNLVMFSSSFQCLPDWQDILQRAGQSARSYLLLSDVATVRNVPAYVVTHRTRGQTYLQMRSIAPKSVAAAERAGMRLVREFPMGAHPPIVNAPEQPTCLGWLFQRGRTIPRSSPAQLCRERRWPVSIATVSRNSALEAAAALQTPIARTVRCRPGTTAGSSAASPRR